MLDAILWPAPVLKIIFYDILTFFFVYILFCRYACRIVISTSLIEINYFFFWDKNIKIPFTNIEEIDYQKGFYDFIDDKAISGLYSFPKYCYDILIVHSNVEPKEVFVNTRIFSFNKVVRYLKNVISKNSFYS